MGFDINGNISGKYKLQVYFEQVLHKYPNWHFDLIQALISIHSVIMFYKRKKTH